MNRNGDNRINPSRANSESDSLPPEKPLGFCCGKFILPSQIHLSLDDFGVSHGILLSEQLRTFAGRPLLLDRYLQRLESGAQTLSIPISLSDLTVAIETVIRHNFPLASSGSDLRVSILVTPGSRESSTPTVIVTTAELPLAQFAMEYKSGIHLATVRTREISGDSIPRHLKHRNRIHYFLSEQEAQQFATEARALLLDGAGNVCEATTAAIAMVRADEGIVAPPELEILGSISLAISLEMLAASGYPIVRRQISPEELRSADEVLWFSSPVCVLPVSKFDGKAVGSGGKRAVFQRLINAWSGRAGFDLVEQANTAKGRG